MGSLAPRQLPARPPLTPASPAAPDLEQQSGGEGKNNLRPLSVHMALRAFQEAQSSGGDDSFMVSNEAIENVTLVGKVCEVENSESLMKFSLDDGSGRLKVKHYSQDMDGPGGIMDIRDNVYMRAFGTLKTSAGEAYLNAHLVRPVTDFNEVTYHSLQIVQTHMHILHKQGYTFDAQGNAVLAAHSAPAPAAAGGFGGYQAPAVPPAGGTQGAAGGSQDPCVAAVLAAIQQAENGGTGLSIDAITARVGKYAAPAVKQALDHLSGEGHIYSTIDENHFAAV